MNGPLQQDSLATRVETKAVIAMADAIWLVGDAIWRTGSVIESLGGRVNDCSHLLLSVWANHTERHRAA